METGSLFSEILYLLPLLLPPHLESDPDCWGTLTPTASMVGSIRNTIFFFLIVNQDKTSSKIKRIFREQKSCVFTSIVKDE